MVTTKNDSFHMPDFEDRLWDELRELHEHRYGERRPEPGRDQRSRRIGYRGAVALLAAVACLVAVVLVTQGSDDQAETGRQPEPSTTTATLVPSFPQDPMWPPPDAAVDAIEVQELRWNDGNTWVTSARWYDEETGAYRGVGLDAAGDVAFELAWIVGADPGTGVTRTVDHLRRTYRDDEGDTGLWPSALTTEGFQEQLEAGDFEAAGTEVVDGVELDRYVSPVPSVCDTDPELAEVCDPFRGEVVWVDPATGRVIRYQQGDGYRVTYAYLPRTDENLALLELAIPEGYHQDEVSSGSAPG